MAYQRKEQKMSKVSVIVSIALHAGIVALLIYFAAREGMFGKHFKKMAVVMIPREEPPVEPPPEIPQPKAEEKPAELKSTSEPTPATPPSSERAPPPAAVIEPVAALAPNIAPPAAPPPAVIPGLFFDGGKNVESSSEPGAVYNSFVEYSLRSNWKRPKNLSDLGFVAEVRVGIDDMGRIISEEWLKRSGNAAWDDSVRQALAKTKTLDRTPPKGFPSAVVVRFDVRTEMEALPR